MGINLRQTDNSKTPQAGCSGRSAAAGTTGAREMTDGGTAGTSEVIVGIQNFGTLLYVYNDISDAINETTWDAPSGGDPYTWRLNITTAVAAVTLEEVYFCRLNSSEVSQETLASATGIGQTISSTGVISGNITTGSAATSPSATDKLAVIYVFTNTNEHGGDEVFGITPNQLIDTPIIRTGVSESNSNQLLLGVG